MRSLWIQEKIILCVVCYISFFHAAAHDNKLLNVVNNIRKSTNQQSDIGQRSRSAEMNFLFVVNDSLVDVEEGASFFMGVRRLRDVDSLAQAFLAMHLNTF